MKKNTNTLCLFLENKFGALERVIGVFTMRGHKIENLVCTKSRFTDIFDLKISFISSDQDLEKLVKILYNQINVLEVSLLSL